MEGRKDVLSWDEYFMSIAVLASRRSKDPNTQVGCCIANNRNVIISIGYNGFPRNCGENDFPWDREGKLEDTKYAYVVHSELNAILNSKQSDLSDCKLYVSLFPCNECAKAIIQSGIKQVYYLCDTHKEDNIYRISKKLFDCAGVKYTQLDFNDKEVVIKLSKERQ